MKNVPLYLIASLDHHKSKRTIRPWVYTDYRKAEAKVRQIATVRRPLILKLNLREALKLSSTLLIALNLYSEGEGKIIQREMDL